MLVVLSEQAVRIRTLAAEFRQAAARTALAPYRAKFEQTARDLDDEACRMEARPRRDS